MKIEVKLKLDLSETSPALWIMCVSTVACRYCYGVIFKVRIGGENIVSGLPKTHLWEDKHVFLPDDQCIMCTFFNQVVTPRVIMHAEMMPALTLPPEYQSESRVSALWMRGSMRQPAGPSISLR